MLVAIRIRPLNQKEIGVQDKDIIRSEDKLLVINIPYLILFRLYWTKLNWYAKKKVKSLKYCIDLENRDISLIGYSLKGQIQRLFILTLVKV